jgi:hypothetical protein
MTLLTTGWGGVNDTAHQVSYADQRDNIYEAVASFK